MSHGKRFRGASVRKYLANLFLGLCVIAVGVGYLGNHLDILPWSDFTPFFPGWGYLLLMVSSVYFLIRSPFSWFWPCCLLAGGLGLISKLDIYPMDTLVPIGLAVLVILIGIRIILTPLFRRLRRNRIRRKVRENLHGNGIVFRDAVEIGSDEGGCYSVRFGERSIRLDEQDFTSATLNISFGEMKFDLSGAHIHDCAVIDANCSFGELHIRVPDYARVEITKSGAFSEISCRHPVPTDVNAPVVYINANCSFGEITVN